MFKLPTITLEKRREVKYKIAFWDLKEQQEYADCVCMQMVKDKYDFLAENKNARLNDDYFSGWNATSVSNVAYITLNSKNTKEVEFYKFILEEYREWLVKNKLAEK